MVDALYHMHEGNVQACANSDGAIVPIRPGAWHPLAGPMGVYKGPQGWIALLILDRQWPALLRAMARPELEHDPRFATGLLRGQNRAELAGMIERWTATFPSDESLLQHLEAHRVPAAPVLSVADTLTHPQFLAREMVRKVPDPVLGEVTIPGFPLKFSELPALPDLRAPLLGQHNGEVLREAGYDDAAVHALESKGVLASGPR